MEAQSATQIEHPQRAQPVLWLHLGFACTGIGTTLLGCVLPALTAAWHLSDARSGLLFAAQFTGSAAGALLVRHDFFASVTRGYLLLTVSAIAIAFLNGPVEPFLFLCFGLGLGWAMTATSMLVSSLFIENRGAALSLLNASWGIGAALCPAVASLWTRHWSPTSLFLALAIVLTITVLLISRHRMTRSMFRSEAIENDGLKTHLRVILIFAILAFLYVGVEASVSGWMMTYVHRLPLASGIWAPIAASCFWIALLSGRTLAPVILRWISEMRLFAWALAIALLSLFLLLLSRTPLEMVLSAVFAGLALAPIFPLCLARVLALTNDSPQTKWIFVVAGLGGAVLPWLTGILSTRVQSLRVGLGVPLFALVVMIAVYCFALPNRLDNSAS
jgi:FHS family glucose/mannose:H+ symporter-like MFS transporter